MSKIVTNDRYFLHKMWHWLYIQSEAEAYMECQEVESAQKAFQEALQLAEMMGSAGLLKTAVAL